MEELNGIQIDPVLMRSIELLLGRAIDPNECGSIGSLAELSAERVAELRKLDGHRVACIAYVRYLVANNLSLKDTVDFMHDVILSTHQLRD